MIDALCAMAMSAGLNPGEVSIVEMVRLSEMMSSDGES